MRSIFLAAPVCFLYSANTVQASMVTAIAGEVLKIPTKKQNQRLEVRLSPETMVQIQKSARERGFRSANSFVRSAIANELRGTSGRSEEWEHTLAASINRLAKEMRSLHNAQQTHYALADAFVRLFLTCIPEPPADVRDAAVARAKLRYEVFLRSVVAGVSGGTTHD